MIHTKVVYQPHVVAFSLSLSMVASCCLFRILFTSFSLSYDRCMLAKDGYDADAGYARCGALQRCKCTISPGREANH